MKNQKSNAELVQEILNNGTVLSSFEINHNDESILFEQKLAQNACEGTISNGATYAVFTNSEGGTIVHVHDVDGSISNTEVYVSATYLCNILQPA